MKPYEPWDFCKSISCLAIEIQEEEYRIHAGCIKCDVYKMHSYLRDHGQIFEAGSEIEKIVQEAERLSKEPTVEQVAWVFEKIIENNDIQGSFRKLIYDFMGFDESAYQPLYGAGGMAITNMLFELHQAKAGDSQ